MITLYSTGCPKCKVLEAKLNQKKVSYEICKDTEVMVEKGYMTLPMLEVDGEPKDFINAISYVNSLQKGYGYENKH